MKLAIALLLLSSCTHSSKATKEPQVLVDLFLTTPPPASGAPACPEFIELTEPITDADAFVAQMAACKGRPVVIEINSPGGSIFEALRMQKAIERHDMPVLCVVDGMAASAAFVTLQSCDMRLMTDRSVLMAHAASVRGVGGQSQELDNAARALNAIDRGMALHCAKRLDMSPDDYAKRTTGGLEWWLGLEDALKFKAVDFEVRDVVEAIKLSRGP